MPRNLKFLLATCLLAAGCTQQPVPFAPPAPPVTAYDGSYKGTIRLIKIAAGAADMRSLCEVRRNMSVQVMNGTFAYSFQLTNYPGRPQARYSALVYPNGEFLGSSERGGEIRGKIAENQLVGRIDSIGCYYEFAATRS